MYTSKTTLALAVTALLLPSLAAADTLYLSIRNDTNLYRVDTTNPTAPVVVGSIGTGFEGLGPATVADAITGLNRDSGDLAVISTTTGAVLSTTSNVERNGGSGWDFNALTGIGYEGDNNRLVFFDTNTNADGSLAPPPAADDVESLAVDPDAGVIYGVGNNGDLQRYDIASDTWTTVGATGIPGLADEGGLAFVRATGNLFYANTDGLLYQLNPSTGAATVLGDTGLGAGQYGLTALATAAPPATGVDISAPTPAAVLYAQEIVASASSPVTLTNTGGSLSLTSVLGYSFTQGEVRYARVECPSTVRFLSGSTVVASDDPASTLGAINGLGSSAITFSITADTTGLTATDTITVTGNRQISAATNASCSFSLYDNPSEAQAGGPSGRIVTRSGAYLAFGPSYALRVTSTGRATADVEGIDGPFTRFIVAAPTNDATRGQLGGFRYGTVADVRGTTQPLSPAGVPVTLADLMGAQTALVFAGDFEAAASVYLSANSDCSTVDATAGSYDTTKASFQVGAGGALGRFLCFEAGTAEIQPGAFTVSLEAEAASAAYAVMNLGPENLGEIVRNGTELMAPLVQMPAGFIARIALTNTGSEKRQFSLQLLSSASGSASEAGSTYVGLTSSDGTIPANGSVVINLAEAFPLERFQGPARGAIRAVVRAPNGQVQGLYQIVNPGSGTISNHVMVRPGAN